MRNLAVTGTDRFSWRMLTACQTGMYDCFGMWMSEDLKDRQLCEIGYVLRFLIKSHSSCKYEP
jgi:hypothetical protein